MRKRALVSLLAAAAATTGVITAPAAAVAPVFAEVQGPSIDDLRAELRAATKAADAAETAYLAVAAKANDAELAAIRAEDAVAAAKAKLDALAGAASSVEYEKAVAAVAAAKVEATKAAEEAERLAKAAAGSAEAAERATGAVADAEKALAEAKEALPGLAAAAAEARDAIAPLKSAYEQKQAGFQAAEREHVQAFARLESARQALAALGPDATEAERAAAEEEVRLAGAEADRLAAVRAEALAARNEAKAAYESAVTKAERAEADLREAERRRDEAADRLPGLRAEAERLTAAAGQDESAARAAATAKTAADAALATAQQALDALESAESTREYREAKAEHVRLTEAAKDARAQADQLAGEAARLKEIWDNAEKRVKAAQAALDAALFPVAISGITVSTSGVRYPGRQVPVFVTVYTKSDADQAVVSCPGFTVALEETVSGVFDSGFHLEPGDPSRATCSVKVSNTHGISATGTFSYAARSHTKFGSLNASPEPVRKGRKLTVTGSLLATNAAGTGYGHLNGARVNILFKPVGKTTWTTMATVTTSGKGVFARSFTASKDGNWKAVYAGATGYVAAGSAADYVDVRR
ncbi:hypothetical protein [Nonomuraea sp. NPDC050310]|uniref:hypothetical protein n=1 Tax=Nonomuraea sp. NPDC050310 TaxID=3154935 RepID=UPI0033D795F8